MLVGIGVAVAGLSRVLDGTGWWFVAMAVAAIVLLAAAIVRSVARRAGWPIVAAVIAAVATITLFFLADSAIVGLIPTVASIGAFGELQEQGLSSIAGQGLPANADQGILFLICLGVAALAVVMDALALVARTPALTGVPLLLLLLVPSLVRPSLDDAFFFALVAAAYLGILAVRMRRRARPAAFGVAAVALVVSLVVPPLLPAPETLEAESSGSGGSLATGINPILNLGDDLRRGDPALALTYTSTAPRGQYLRLTALDDFTGVAWEPTAIEVDAGNTVAEFGPPPGLIDAVPRTEETTEVEVSSIRSRWLPAPYAPASIQGLVGAWSWEPEGLAIRSERANARNQQYRVESIDIAPSIEQLVAAGTVVPTGLERYLQLPADLPAVVGETALAVVGAAPSNYDRAVALQAYFRSGDFFYSEEAPVQDGYDGSGALVLADFLEAKTGYCVHFSSAMAAMARTLGIPARIAVGFTPGQATTVPGDDGEMEVEYRVTTHNLHSWPELYFADIGWVRFEPTPGRGTPPAFAPLVADDPATPDVDESEPLPESTSTPTAAPVAPEALDPETAEAGGTDAATPVTSTTWALAALVLLLLVPWALRAIRRARRLRFVDDGSATAAWDELRDTADDLGLATSDTRTPRQLVIDLAPHLDERGRASLERVRAALESEAFARRDGLPDSDDLRAVLRALRRQAGIPRRLIAALAPRSLVQGLGFPVSRAG